MVGTGRGAEQGILIKSGESLETVHLVDTVVLDKTGTITQGHPSVTDIRTMSGISKKELLSLAASLEQASEHPLAEAITDYAKENETTDGSDALRHIDLYKYRDGTDRICGAGYRSIGAGRADGS